MSNHSLPPFFLVCTLGLGVFGCSDATGSTRTDRNGASGFAGESATSGGTNAAAAGGASASGGAAGADSGGASAGTSSAGGAAGGSGGASGAAGSAMVYPPGPPGCGLEQAAFCETFDAPSTPTGRSGELDGARWSVTRMCNIGLPSVNGRAVAVGPATLPACRADLPAQVLPSSDSLICDGNDAIASNHLLAAVAAQNYGQNSYRIRQPFDFTDRTGVIVFDAEGRNVGNHGWLSLEITEEPSASPSFTLAQNFENGAIPKNALELQFYDGCGSGGVGISHVLSYENYAQTQIAGAQGLCVTAAQGHLNHFEIHVSNHQVEVYASPHSANGTTFDDVVLLGSFALELPFSRGYVQLTAHNHATLKYSDGTMDAWLARFDNVGFDGPQIIGATREFGVPDALSAADAGMVNLGWRLADESKGPAQVLEIDGVDPSGATSAALVVQNWVRHEPNVDPLPTEYSLNYRLNGKAFKSRALDADQLQMMTDLPNAGTMSMLLDVDVADLVSGKNTLEFTASNAATDYPPVVLNVDLIVRTD